MPVAQKWLKELFIMGWSYNFYFYWHYSVAIFVLHVSMSTHTNFKFSNSKFLKVGICCINLGWTPWKNSRYPFCQLFEAMDEVTKWFHVMRISVWPCYPLEWKTALLRGMQMFLASKNYCEDEIRHMEPFGIALGTQQN